MAEENRIGIHRQLEGGNRIARDLHTMSHLDGTGEHRAVAETVAPLVTRSIIRRYTFTRRFGRTTSALACGPYGPTSRARCLTETKKWTVYHQPNQHGGNDVGHGHRTGCTCRRESDAGPREARHCISAGVADQVNNHRQSLAQAVGIAHK